MGGGVAGDLSPTPLRPLARCRLAQAGYRIPLGSVGPRHRGGNQESCTGALLGLYDWRYDVLATIEHGNYLRRAYGLEPHAIGIPRLKPARGVLASQKSSRFTVSDDDYRLILSLYHLAFPRSRLFFNTRENYEMNISMVAAGDLFTVDCDTFPGGYLRNDTPGQFSTHGFPSRREVAGVFAARGSRVCIWKPKPRWLPPHGPRRLCRPIS